MKSKSVEGGFEGYDMGYDEISLKSDYRVEQLPKYES